MNQRIELPDAEQIELYMTLEKEELAKMLLQANKNRPPMTFTVSKGFECSCEQPTLFAGSWNNRCKICNGLYDRAKYSHLEK